MASPSSYAPSNKEGNICRQEGHNRRSTLSSILLASSSSALGFLTCPPRRTPSLSYSPVTSPGLSIAHLNTVLLEQRGRRTKDIHVRKWYRRLKLSSSVAESAGDQNGVISSPARAPRPCPRQRSRHLHFSSPPQHKLNTNTNPCHTSNRRR